MSTLGPGVTVDRYRLVAPAGEGGQGSVWRAEDPLRNGAPVALKLLPLSAAPPTALERFRREARALAHLSHPSLPRCHALFEDLRHDVIGLVLDFIEGSPLAVLLASERLGPDHRVWALRHLAAALAYIHDAGLVHRDVKPPNVMIAERFFDHPADPEGVKLVDFGIAAEPNNPKPLTLTGSVIGTLEFLAPEILDRGYWKGPADGPERDVFALGVLAYELLRGKHPTGVTDEAPLGDYLVAYREHANDDAFPPGIAGDPLEAFYRRCLALRSEKRAPTGAEAVALLGNAGGSAVRVPTSRASLETARTEIASITTDVQPRSRARSFAKYAGAGVGTAGLFAISFFVAYSQKIELPPPVLPPALANGIDRDKASPTAEEPPNPTVAPKPSRPSPPPRATATAAAVSTAVATAFPATLTCPPEMVPVAGPPPFCIDKREVTVAEYRKCGSCGPAKDAYWIGPTFSEKAKAEQTQNCSNTRPGLDNYPINCVAYQDAVSYCAGVGKRLPRMDEWRKARSAISLCNEVGGLCPLFEWSSDPTSLAGYRSTRGPSFRYLTALEGSNVEVARNDDLGFRCAKDPAAK